jgi:hypothetical protein
MKLKRFSLWLLVAAFSLPIFSYANSDELVQGDVAPSENKILLVDANQNTLAVFSHGCLCPSTGYTYPHRSMCELNCRSPEGCTEVPGLTCPNP